MQLLGHLVEVSTEHITLWRRFCLKARRTFIRAVWIGAGSQDPIIPATEAQRLAELLRRAGADVTIRFANASHDLTDADVRTARHWLGGLQSWRSKNLLPLRRISLLSERK